MTRPKPHVAVIGAGIAGLACAGRLRQAGVAVSLFDKGRRAGGRCATRRAGPVTFDHGAQYCTAADGRFREALAAGEAAGLVARWQPRPGRLPQSGDAGREDEDRRWVGVPGMSSLAQHLGRGLPVQCGTRIAAVEPDGGRWRLGGENGLAAGPFDIVLVAVPAPQATALLAPAPVLADRVRDAVLAPCWALMLAFAEPLSTELVAAFVDAGSLAWICHDGGKPGRGGEDSGAPTTWVAHASPAWSRTHLEEDPADIAPAMLAAFAEVIGLDLPPPVHLAAHRWRYARVETALDEPCLYDPRLGLGACGDWCLGPRIESAFLSGLAMAERVLAQASPRFAD
ncbi:MAG TPA: NAD(P)-binding protein [Rhodospirillales bacterium]|nr:NAD(P)-binding protein [Rhodospirillales bacterium]